MFNVVEHNLSKGMHAGHDCVRDETQLNHFIQSPSIVRNIVKSILSSAMVTVPMAEFAKSLFDNNLTSYLSGTWMKLRRLTIPQNSLCQARCHFFADRQHLLPKMSIVEEIVKVVAIGPYILVATVWKNQNLAPLVILSLKISLARLPIAVEVTGNS